MFARHARVLLLTACTTIAMVACAKADTDNEANEREEMAEAPMSTMASGDYKREIPADLAAKASITEARAAEIALAAVPGGTIESVELEEEDGQFLYSYDIRVAGKQGIDEVHVDAMSGTILKQEHESPEDEKAEAAEDDEAADSSSSRM
jgi:uncharacterized membrane protein YkoI